jgi:hypothetical protein
MMRRTASMFAKNDKARRERALSRPELGTNGGTHNELRHVALWSGVKVVDEKTRKLIDEYLELHEIPPRSTL